MGAGNEFLIKGAMALALAAFVFMGVYFQMKADEENAVKRAEYQVQDKAHYGQALMDTCEELKARDPRYNATLAAHMAPEYDDVMTHTSGAGKPQVRIHFHDYNVSGYTEETAVYSEAEPTRNVYAQSKDIIKGFLAQYKDMPNFADMRFGICIYKSIDGQIIGDFRTLQRVEESSPTGATLSPNAVKLNDGY